MFSLLAKSLRQLSLGNTWNQLSWQLLSLISTSVATHLDQYLAKTESLRGSTSQLLLNYVKPHKAISNTTIGKWSKSVLKDAGIDVTKFTSHSGWSTSTSYAAQTSLTLKEILKPGGWSNAQTFTKHYNMPIVRNFGTSVLEHFRNNSRWLCASHLYILFYFTF